MRPLQPSTLGFSAFQTRQPAKVIVRPHTASPLRACPIHRHPIRLQIMSSQQPQPQAQELRRASIGGMLWLEMQCLPPHAMAGSKYYACKVPFIPAASRPLHAACRNSRRSPITLCIRARLPRLSSPRALTPASYRPQQFFQPPPPPAPALPAPKLPLPKHTNTPNRDLPLQRPSCSTRRRLKLAPR
jgi:hypothetical protein